MVVTYRLRRDFFMEAAKRFKALDSSGQEEEGSETDAVRSRGQRFRRKVLNFAKKR